MIKVFQEKYKPLESQIDSLIASFDEKGEQLKDARNKLKVFKLDEFKVNIKSFRVPGLINQIVYRFFRKGKAQRSFEYANKLLSLGIGTPNPIAYYENKTALLFKKSFYVSEQLGYDLTYRELLNDLDFPDRESILRTFTRFTFELHEKGVNFLDHSPGNTLIKKTPKGYDFYLVDLNRMRFETLSFEERIKNFARLSKYKEMVEIMSDEYSKCINETYDKVFSLMWSEVQLFRSKVERKKRLKKSLLFWRNKR